MTLDVTVCIPTIPPRQRLLERALLSVRNQTITVPHISVAVDHSHEGAALTRQRALDAADSEWVAFLDDDDEFLPNHLERLSRAAEEQSADYVFSWYTVVGGEDPRPDEFGKPWDPDHPRQTTITTLVRASLAQAAGFVPDVPDLELNSPDRHYAGEDWLFTSRCHALGATFYHLPERTWLWHHDSNNTSGLPSRW